MTNIKERTLMFDNDIYDFYLSLDIKSRLNSSLTRYAIRNINNKIGKIPTGNWGFPAKDGPFIKTLKLIIRKLLRIATNNQKYKAPSAKERTWPDRETLISENIFIRKEINKIFNDEKFKNLLNKIDWKKLENYKNKWLKDQKGGAKFLVSLFSIYKFYQLTLK